MNHRRKFGLTIAELLTVIVIIAILTGLLLSVFSGAKNKAKQTVCVSNLHQLQIAMAMYKEDNGDYPPGSLIWPAFKQYYPSLLQCPVSTSMPRGEYDYLPVGTMESLKDSKYGQCKLLRGSDIPIVVDINHLKRSQTGDTPVVIVARENGAISTKVFINVASRKHGQCEEIGLPFYFDF